MWAGLNVYTPVAQFVAGGTCKYIEYLTAEWVGLLMFDKKSCDVVDLVQQYDIRAQGEYVFRGHGVRKNSAERSKSTINTGSLSR